MSSACATWNVIINLNNYLTSNGRHPEALRDETLWTGEYSANAAKTIAMASEIQSLSGVEIVDITSGYRYPSLNKKVGGSSSSKHMFAQAIDLSDKTGELGKWAMANIAFLRSRGWAMESLAVTHFGEDKTKWWVHFQTQLPKSGNVIFSP